MPDPEVFIDWGRGPDYTAVRVRSSVSMPLVHCRGFIDSWALTLYFEQYPTHRVVWYADYGVQLIGGRAHMVSEWILSERFT